MLIKYVMVGNFIFANGSVVLKTVDWLISIAEGDITQFQVL